IKIKKKRFVFIKNSPFIQGYAPPNGIINRAAPVNFGSCEELRWRGSGSMGYRREALLTRPGLAEIRVEPLHHFSLVVGRVFRPVEGRPMTPAFDADQLHRNPHFL